MNLDSPCTSDTDQDEDEGKEEEEDDDDEFNKAEDVEMRATMCQDKGSRTKMQLTLSRIMSSKQWW